MATEEGLMINKRVANIIALVVTGVWALSFVASAVPGSSYKADPYIHTVMLAVAGGLFASGLRGDK